MLIGLVNETKPTVDTEAWSGDLQAEHPRTGTVTHSSIANSYS